MKPYLFWVLFVILLLQQITIKRLENKIDNRWNKTLENTSNILEVRKDLDATIYAIGTE